MCISHVVGIEHPPQMEVFNGLNWTFIHCHVDYRNVSKSLSAVSYLNPRMNTSSLIATMIQ